MTGEKTNGSTGKSRLAGVLSDGTNDEKAALLDSLREARDVNVIPQLIQALEKEKSRVLKERILLVLDTLMPLDDFREADHMLRSPDPFVRNGIVAIIKNHQVPIIRFLEKLAEDPDKDVRKFVIDALSLEQSEQVIEIIRRRLDDPEVNILYTAIEYLGNFKDSQSAEKIESIVLNSGQLMVICAGLEALAKMNRSPSRDKILERFMGARVQTLVSFPMLKYIGAFGTEADFPFIEHIIDTCSVTFTKEIVDSISHIVKNRGLTQLPLPLRRQLEDMQARTDNSVDKYSITKLLVRVNTGEPGELLVKLRGMLFDDDEVIKLCAVELLAEAGDESDIQRIETAAGETESSELQEAAGDAVMAIYKRVRAPGSIY